MVKNVIECKNLTQFYGDKKIYENLSFSIQEGSVVALLGKNGVGKSTTINILMGNLEPTSGECLIYSSKSSALPKEIKARIGLLYEGYITYDYMRVKELLRLYSQQYKARFKKELFFELFDKLDLSINQKISTLSCGQKSQIILGLIFASDPDLLILDDYSLGLDTGYRRLFIEFLHNFIKDKNKSVLMTTHIVNDLDGLLDDIIILRKNSEPLQMKYADFRAKFKGFNVDKNVDLSQIKGIESKTFFNDKVQIYGFIEENIQNSEEMPLSFEDAFLGYTGRY